MAVSTRFLKIAVNRFRPPVTCANFNILRFYCKSIVSKSSKMPPKRKAAPAKGKETKAALEPAEELTIRKPRGKKIDVVEEDTAPVTAEDSAVPKRARRAATTTKYFEDADSTKDEKINTKKGKRTVTPLSDDEEVVTTTKKNRKPAASASNDEENQKVSSKKGKAAASHAATEGETTAVKKPKKATTSDDDEDKKLKRGKKADTPISDDEEEAATSKKGKRTAANNEQTKKDAKKTAASKKNLKSNGDTAPKKRVRKLKSIAEGESETEEHNGDALQAAPAKRGRKLKNDTEEKPDEEPEKKSSLMNPSTTDYSKISFPCTKKNKLGETANFCIASWNVDGLRAWLKKDGLAYIDNEKPNVFCIQESKCSAEKLPNEIKNLDGYKQYWHNSEKEGYAGVGVFTQDEPLSVKYGIGVADHDEEGRCVTVEFNNFFVVNVYVPNAGRKLVTLPKRLEWNKAFKLFIKDLDEKKPVIVCGDMNVAHLEIDLANPKTNTKNAGFTVEEREGMTEFLADGYVDTYRNLYPDKTGVYTFWTYMMKSRSKNVGWRLDYFIVSKRLVDNVCDNVVRSEVLGSDHCPIALFLNI